MDFMQQLGNLALASRLKRLSDYLMSQVSDIYRQQGIEMNSCYFPLFRLIAKNGPQSVTQAANQLAVSHPAVSKLARKMITDGLLEKVSCTQDERRSLLQLSPQAQQVVDKANPVWQAISDEISTLSQEQRYPILASLNEFETMMQNQGFCARVQQRIDQGKPELNVINWQSTYKDDFARLNLEWLNQYFNGELTDSDKTALYQPESYYLSRGGYIFFALLDNELVGTCALRKAQDNYFELSKMAVSPQAQGHGVGRQMLLFAIEKARTVNACGLWLESNSRLTRATTLYENLGFCHQPFPQGKPSYPRSDVYMSLEF